MYTNEIHKGGCSCGALRYLTTGKPERVEYVAVDIVKPEQVLLLVFQSTSKILIFKNIR